PIFIQPRIIPLSAMTRGCESSPDAFRHPVPGFEPGWTCTPARIHRIFRSDCATRSPGAVHCYPWQKGSPPLALSVRPPAKPGMGRTKLCETLIVENVVSHAFRPLPDPLVASQRHRLDPSNPVIVVQTTRREIRHD